MYGPNASRQEILHGRVEVHKAARSPVSHGMMCTHHQRAPSSFELDDNPGTVLSLVGIQDLPVRPCLR